MSKDNISEYLMQPNTLRKLSGREDELKLLEHSGDNYFGDIGEETMSVEIITLSQHRYELAFEEIISSREFMNMDIERMAEEADSIMNQFDHVRPHIEVKEGEITIVMDCVKIDTQIVQYASQLLSQIPSMDIGFYWEFLKKEDKK